MNVGEVTTEHVLRAAARHFVARPFVEVSMTDITDDLRADLSIVARIFSDTHAMAAAVLDHERKSMHGVQHTIAQSSGSYLDRILQAFHAVGENLAHEVIVRAGVCLAAGSRHYFPERRLDPFGTWLSSIEDLLRSARAAGELRRDVHPESAAWTIVAAGMGTMDFARTQNRWSEVQRRLEQTAQTIVHAIAVPSDECLRSRK